MAKHKTESKSSPAKGFQLKKITTVVAVRYAKMSDAKKSRDNPDLQRVSIINDTTTVARLVELVNALPPKGHEMIDMGDAELIQASFSGHYDDPVTTVKLYAGHVQAPDTSFYAGLPEEKEIYRILSEAKPRPKTGLRVKAAKIVRIEEYDHGFYERSESAPNRLATITNPQTVAELLELLNQMPLTGEIFASHTGGVKTTHVFFVDDKSEETVVDLLAGGISTTDGSFYAGGKGQELEDKFKKILDAELAKTAPECRYAFDASNAQTIRLMLKKITADRYISWELVSEPKVIKKIQAALAKLPTKGEMMKSWGDDTEVLSATFSRPGAPKTCIEFYNGRLKTTDTSFYAADSNPEKPLYELLKKQFR